MTTKYKQKREKKLMNQRIFYEEKAQQGDEKAKAKLAQIIKKQEELSLLVSFSFKLSKKYDADVILQLEEMQKNRMLENYIRELVRADMEKSK